MASRCLSAAGLRFLDRPPPTGTSGRSYESRTDHSQIPLGLSRSAPSRIDWDGCLLYSGVVVSLPRGVCEPPATESCALSVMLLTRHCRLAQSSCPATPIYGASPKIHLRSPVQSFLGLGTVDD